MTKAMPATPGARLALLKLLVDQKQWDSAQSVWQQVIQNRQSFDSKNALFYVDALVAQGNVDSAAQAWQTLASRDTQIAERSTKGNLLVNASFEQNILNGGFDWIYQRIDGVDVSVETAEFHSGSRSLALNFDMENIGVTGLKQFVPVQPNSRYSFSAWMRADSVETANGPRLLLSDAKTHQPVFSSEDALGTFPWRRITGGFVTGPGSDLLELSVVRNPANGRIRGKIWIDDLELVRE